MSSFRFVGSCVLFSASVLAIGCKSNSNRTEHTRAAASASATSVASAAVSNRGGASIPRPTGPAFAVEAGGGLGPIRFGSTVATVERHMQSKCEELSEKYCRYVTAGIELELTDGAVSGILVHRLNRPVAGNSEKKWGIFAGGLPPKVMMMMVPEAVIEQIGKPKKTETVTEENPNWTVRRDFYDGLELEYDRNRANDRLMLGQIRVVKTK